MGTSLPAEVLPTITRHFTTHMQAKKSKANYTSFLQRGVYLLWVQCFIIKKERGEREEACKFVYVWESRRGFRRELILTELHPQCKSHLRDIRILGVTFYRMKPEMNGATEIWAVNNWVQLLSTNGISLSKKLNRRNYPNQMLISQYFLFLSPLKAMCATCWVRAEGVERKRGLLLSVQVTKGTEVHDTTHMAKNTNCKNHAI